MDNLGAVLRAARTAAKVSLSGMAKLTHYSKPYLGQLETGHRPISPEHVKTYEQVLGVDIERLASVAIAPRRVDASSLADVATILSTTRRLEDAAGSAVVLPAVRGFALLAQSLTHEARSTLGSQSASLASEIAQYRGWLEVDTGDIATAKSSLDRAICLAQQANDPDRLVHGLSFKAYAALEDDRHSDAAALTDAALRVSRAHPLMRVYDFYQRARVHAVSGEPFDAQKALVLADRAAEAAADEDPPESGYWYTEGLWGLHRGRVLWLIGSRAEGAREIQQGLAAMPEEHRDAEWATKWVQAALDGDLETFSSTRRQKPLK